MTAINLVFLHSLMENDKENPEIVEKYKRFLANVMQDGILDEKEGHRLQKFRTKFGISDATHQQLMAKYRPLTDAMGLASVPRVGRLLRRRQ